MESSRADAVAVLVYLPHDSGRRRRRSLVALRIVEGQHIIADCCARCRISGSSAAADGDRVLVRVRLAHRVFGTDGQALEHAALAVFQGEGVVYPGSGDGQVLDGTALAELHRGRGRHTAEIEQRTETERLGLVALATHRLADRERGAALGILKSDQSIGGGARVGTAGSAGGPRLNSGGVAVRVGSCLSDGVGDTFG